MAEVLFDTPGTTTGTPVLPDGKHQRVNLVYPVAGGGSGGGTVTSAKDIPVVLTDITGKNPIQTTVQEALQTLKNDEAQLGDQVQEIQSTLSVLGDAGMRGDYCSRYAVVRWPNGRPRLGTTKNTIVIPNGMRIAAPGTRANPDETLIHFGSDETITLESTTDCYLIYVPGHILECEQLCFTPKKPEDTPTGKCRAWWDGLEWKVRHVDQGDVWTACRAHVLCKCHFTDGTLTRLSFVGWYDSEE